MAQMLKQVYDLLVLRIEQEVRTVRHFASQQQPPESTTTRSVRFVLEAKDEGVLQTVLDVGRCSTEDLGVPQALEAAYRYRDPDFWVPPSFLDAIQGWITDHEHGHRPLWIHLQKPYGMLGAIPWERLLQPRLEVPVVRLPDFFQRAPDHLRPRVNVLLCGSLPAAKRAFDLVGGIDHTVRRIQEAVPAGRSVRIHVFVDSRVEEDLTQRWSESRPPGVVLHPAGGVQQYTEPDPTTRILDATGQMENPWLLWMRDALEGESIDLAHFITHGYQHRDQGAIALAPTPVVNENRFVARFVGARQLEAFLDQVGAWGLVLSSPQNNYSELGLRLLADKMAQLRPGTVMHHDLARDGDLWALAAGYRFVLAPPPATPPATPALILCTEPYRTVGEERAPEESIRTHTFKQVLPPPPPAEELKAASQEAPPSWVTATERFFEASERAVYLQQKAADLDPPLRRLEKMNTQKSVLRKLEGLVTRLASKHLGSEGL